MPRPETTRSGSADLSEDPRRKKHDGDKKTDPGQNPKKRSKPRLSRENFPSATMPLVGRDALAFHQASDLPTEDRYPMISKPSPSMTFEHAKRHENRKHPSPVEKNDVDDDAIQPLTPKSLMRRLRANPSTQRVRWQDSSMRNDIRLESCAQSNRLRSRSGSIARPYPDTWGKWQRMDT